MLKKIIVVVKVQRHTGDWSGFQPSTVLCHLEPKCNHHFKIKSYDFLETLCSCMLLTIYEKMLKKIIVVIKVQRHTRYWSGFQPFAALRELQPKHNHHFKTKSYDAVRISYLHIALMICIKKN